MKINKFRAFMAVFVTSLSFGFLYMITLVPAAREATSNDTILGFLLGTGLSAVINFYFGSSDEKPKQDNPE